MHHNTLGLAFYRTGRYSEAVAAALNPISGTRWMGLCPLISIFWRCRVTGCRRGIASPLISMPLAVRWSDAHREATNPYLAELAVIQAEAAEVLGVKVRRK